MSRLIISTWRWGSKYGPEYVDRLKAGVARNMVQPYEFRVFTPEPEDAYLTEVKGCFARLRMFDTAWQKGQGIAPGDRIVCMDLDLVVTGPLDALFDRSESFVILQGANSANPCPYNGSLQMLRAGTHGNVWADFSLEAAAKTPVWEFPDDQGYLSVAIPKAGAWKAGAESGVYAYQKTSWPRGEALPRGAKIVAFPGWRDPAGFSHLPWVSEHWRA